MHADRPDLAPRRGRWPGGTRGRRTLTLLSVVGLCLAGLTSCRTAEPEVSGHCAAFGLDAADPRADAALDRSSPEVHLAARHREDGLRGRFHLFTEGIDWERPVGLLVRLHGDGAEEYTVPEGLLTCLAAEAASHNLVLLTPLTPDGSNERTWWMELDQNRAWLTSLVRTQVEQLGVDPQRIWWMGYSGGAEMLSYGILPEDPELVTGGAVLLGGGGDPGWTTTTAPASVREGACLQWIVGEEDDGSRPGQEFDALAASRDGASRYRRLGFAQVGLEVVPGEDHLSLPQSGWMDRLLQQGCPLV